MITNDVEVQRQQPAAVVGHSDAYMCGVPFKRRRLATQHRPHGAVSTVMQGNAKGGVVWPCGSVSTVMHDNAFNAIISFGRFVKQWLYHFRMYEKILNTSTLLHLAFTDLKEV